jgi:hypothetical protein
MFSSTVMRLNVGFADAQAGLAGLAGGSFLRHASGTAYNEGAATGQAGVGPVGPALSLPRLVNVRCLEPVVRDVFTCLAVRWEVAGQGGSPFPVLDADIVLVPHADGDTVLEVSGAYRQPHGTLGAELNRIALHGIAEVTIRAFARHVGVAIIAATRRAEAR